MINVSEENVAGSSKKKVEIVRLVQGLNLRPPD